MFIIMTSKDFCNYALIALVWFCIGEISILSLVTSDPYYLFTFYLADRWGKFSKILLLTSRLYYSTTSNLRSSDSCICSKANNHYLEHFNLINACMPHYLALYSKRNLKHETISVVCCLNLFTALVNSICTGLKQKRFRCTE